MARITIKDFKAHLGVNNTYDIMNAILTDIGYQEYAGLANANNIAELGAGILSSRPLMNDFVHTLVDRISLVVVRNITLTNDFRRFKSGNLEFGRKIEEIQTDLAEAALYDPEVAEKEVFKRVKPDVKVLFHERNREEMYKQTIQNETLKKAFVSWSNFESFLSSIITSIYNSNAVDEYKYCKLVLENYYSKGLFKNVVVNAPNNEITTKDFVRTARMMFRKITLGNGSREFNAMGLHTRTEEMDVHLFITPELEANVDVDVLARAFNMDRTNFMGNVTVIDGFADKNIQAIMVDRNWFMMYDNLFTMESIWNPQGLYWNYYLHVWQILSASRMHNAVAFVTNSDVNPVPPVSQIVVTPNTDEIRKGNSAKFTAIVRESVNVSQEGVSEIEWTIEGREETTSSITQEGVVMVGTDEPNTQLVVKATITYPGKDEETQSVVGEALVNVAPPKPQ